MYKFDKDAVVCFLGDSITARGRWLCRILDYYRENMSECNLKVFNCGRSGGNASIAIKRMETDMFIYKPTDVVIMFGMNDIRQNLYECDEITEEIFNERRNAIELYEKSMQTIAETLDKMGINLIFCTPTPTDIEQISEVHAKPGTRLALSHISRIVKDIAARYGGHVVDFYSQFSDMIDVLRKDNPHNNIVAPDRVHPVFAGEEVMANIFLRAQGFDVPIYDKMQDWQQVSEKPFSAHTEKIFELTQYLRGIAYVEWGLLFGVEADEIDKTLESLYNDPETTDFKKNTIELYKEHIAKKEEYLKRLIEIS